MKTRIVRIGNSQGVRIPKPFLEQTGLRGEVEISVQNNSVVIKPYGKPRAGWARAFQEMADRGDDAREGDAWEGDVPSLTAWDEEEWEWR